MSMLSASAQFSPGLKKPSVWSCQRQSEKCSARTGAARGRVNSRRNTRRTAVDNDDGNAADEEQPQPPPPPYSALSVPVYSMATVPAADSGLRPSMNITTYACPVTIKPSRRMAVALYTHTVTARVWLAHGCMGDSNV